MDFSEQGPNRSAVRDQAATAMYGSTPNSLLPPWMSHPTVLGNEWTKTGGLLPQVRLVVCYHSKMTVGFPSDGRGPREMASLGALPRDRLEACHVSGLLYRW